MLAGTVKRRARKTAEHRIADVSRRLRQFREHRGLTQEVLARHAKLTPKFVSQIENGHVNPSIAVLQRLVEDGLNIPLALFFASELGDDRGDLSTLLALVSAQPPDVRRRVLRVMKALLEPDELDEPHRPRS